jgi:acyl-ACP thioesterase
VIAGRVFEQAIRPGIADCVAGGRARVDAIARWLQDVAYLDFVDAGFGDEEGMWILRKTRLRIESFPRFGEELTVRTWCSGVGRFAAERRTRIEGEAARVDAAGLWVWLDPQTLRPLRFSERFLDVYGPSAGERGAKVRLGHPDPPAAAARRPWSFRAADVDVAGHVNNSHYWAPLEEEYAAADDQPESLDAEIEYRDPAHPGEALVLTDGPLRWITSPADSVYASIQLGA